MPRRSPPAPSEAASREPRRFDAGGELLLLQPEALERVWPPFCAPANPDYPGYSLDAGDSGVAIVDIEGPLDQRGCWYWQGYDTTARAACAAFLDPKVDVVVLRVESPGGEAAGCFQGCEVIDRAKVASGKKLIAIIDETAQSAAYALACVADEVLLPPSGVVGSVGAVVTYKNITGALKEAGIRVAVLASGKQKADGSPLKPWDEEAVARLQADVDYLAGLFFDHVAVHRRMTAEAVKALEAASYRGQAAVAAGLADRVMSTADALAHARTLAEQARAARASAARPVPRSPFSTARASAEKAPTMKLIALKLGLPEDASEEAIAAALTSLLGHKTTLDELCSVTGKPTSAEALGVVKGWHKTAEAYQGLLADRAQEQATARAAAIDGVFAKALEEGRLTPADVAAQRKLMDDGVLQLDTDLRIAAYRAEMENRPVKVPGKAIVRASGETTVVGKRWEDMSTEERHRLYNDPHGGRALYDASLADFRARKGTGGRLSPSVDRSALDEGADEPPAAAPAPAAPPARATKAPASTSKGPQGSKKAR